MYVAQILFLNLTVSFHHIFDNQIIHCMYFPVDHDFTRVPLIYMVYDIALEFVVSFIL
jgi:hypothetical protein